MIKRVMNSTLSIAVLIVHVGCIIEVHPSKSPLSSSGSSPSLQNNPKRSYYSSFELTPAASQSASYNTRQSFGSHNLVERPYRGRKFLTSTTSKQIEKISSTPTTTFTTINSPTTTTTISNDEIIITLDDSCAGKADGYYQNYGSSCTGYYFCAAGYQMTYICPPGKRFDGKKCNDDYECPKKLGFANPCAHSKNGYYANLKSHGKYYYCFQQAKVIELQCDSGKVFIGDKCVTSTLNISTNGSDHTKKEKFIGIEVIVEKKEQSNLKQEITYHHVEDKIDDPTCSNKKNGFYPEEKSGCKKYYYCINREKTELNCQFGFLFNGDICVHDSRYECPFEVPDKITDASKRSNFKSIDGKSFIISSQIDIDSTTAESMERLSSTG